MLFRSLINFGHRWVDREHPQHRYFAEWQRTVGDGMFSTLKGVYAELLMLKKSNMVANLNSPFLKWSATRYAISHFRYPKSPHYELVDELDSPVTYGRDFRGEVHCERFFVYRIRRAVPRAYIPKHCVVVATLGEMIKHMRAGNTEAVVLGGNDVLTKTSGRIDSAEWQGSEASLGVSMATDGYLVVSDPFFPGWEVEVNGTPYTMHRANYAFQIGRAHV